MGHTFGSVANALRRLITSDLLPGDLLRLLTEMHELPHNGTFFDHTDCPGVVTVLQRRFNPIDPERGIPFKRWQLDWRTMDALYHEKQESENLWLLEEMGILHDKAAFHPSKQFYEYVLVHGNFLSQSFAIWELFIKLWNEGLRCAKIFLLADGLVLDQGNLPEDLRRLCEQSSLPIDRGRVVDFQTGVEMLQCIWQSLYLPGHMDAVPIIPLCAPPSIGPDGKPVTAQTEDTLSELLRQPGFVPWAGDILTLSCAPYTLRQHLATELALREHCPGQQIETLGAALSEARSLTIFNREAANLAWLIRRGLELGWRPA